MNQTVNSSTYLKANNINFDKIIQQILGNNL